MNPGRSGGHDGTATPTGGHDSTATPPAGGHRGAARSLPAGLADVALGSATSFVVGIDAARHLDAVSLGLWGLIFSAYLLAAVVPTEFLLVPFEAALVRRAPEEQMRALPRTMMIASLIGVPASVLAMTLAAGFSRGVDPGVAGRTAAIGVMLGITSPLQDHLRRVLHQAGWSSGAATVSCCQLLVVLGCVFGFRYAGLPGLYIPPLSLALSNVASLGFGVLAAARRAGRGVAAPLVLHRATRVGGWLLGAGIADRASQFGCLALLSLWVGNAGVGQYEATRVAAQPVLVCALGVLSVYRRPIMHGAQLRQQADARRAGRTFTGVVLAAAGLYSVVVGVRWVGNPLTVLTPAAYTRAGFLLAVIAATALTATVMAPTTELVGSGWTKAYAHQIVYLAVGLLAGCLLALLLGAGVFAWPLALAGRAAALSVLLRRETRAIYDHVPGQAPHGTASPLTLSP